MYFEERKILEPRPALGCSSYVLIVRVLVKAGDIHTFGSGFSQKRLTFCLAISGHVLKSFRLGVLRQHVLQQASLL